MMCIFPIDHPSSHTTLWDKGMTLFKLKRYLTAATDKLTKVPQVHAWLIDCLNHWGRATLTCFGKSLVQIMACSLDSAKLLSKLVSRWQAIILTSAGILLIVPPLGKKLRRNWNRNSNIFFQENAFGNVVCEMASIVSWPGCVEKGWYVLSKLAPIKFTLKNGYWNTTFNFLLSNNT